MGPFFDKVICLDRRPNAAIKRACIRQTLVIIAPNACAAGKKICRIVCNIKSPINETTNELTDNCNLANDAETQLKV
eukprot:4770992-Pyramimonas_sp.AAC.1